MSPPSETPSIDRDSVLPLHKQIEGWLRSQIDTGALAPGDALPARKELAEMFDGVNHLTVRQAIGSLIRDGLLFSVQGRGTFVTEKKEKELRIALVLPNIDDEITVAIAHGVHEAFEEYDVSRSGDGNPNTSKVAVVMMDSRHSAEREIANVLHLEDMPLDGALIFPVMHGDLAEHLVRLKADNFPVIFLDCAVPGINFPSVTVDNYQGTYDATMHVLKSGKRRPAWIGNNRGYSSATARYEGYRDAIADFGLNLDRKLSCFIESATPLAPYETSTGEVLHKLLRMEEGQRPDAILCQNDLFAMFCLSQLQQRGVSVPDEIAVVGFDDRTDAANSVPALTTVRQPSKEVGRRGAKLILEWILNKKSKPASVELPVSVIVRESTRQTKSSKPTESFSITPRTAGHLATT